MSAKRPHRTPKSPLVSLLEPTLFRSLADPTRLQMLHRLSRASEPQTVTEIADCCGVHLSGVSRHLAALREAGVVSAHKQGREVRYVLDCGRVAAAFKELAEAFEQCAASQAERPLSEE